MDGMPLQNKYCGLSTDFIAVIFFVWEALFKRKFKNI